jgi:hypothetical protein
MDNRRELAVDVNTADLYPVISLVAHACHAPVSSSGSYQKKVAVDVTVLQFREQIATRFVLK